MYGRLVLVVVTVVGFALCVSAQYKPNWESLDSRPIPAWFDEAKLGIFMTWGVYCVPAYYGSWIWEYWKGQPPRAAVVDFIKNNYPPDWTYADFASQFKAELFDPNQWAELFEASGAKYVVLTSKHHDGFTNWPSKFSFNWNSMDVGPKKDLVGLLANAIRNKTDLYFGLYHSLFEFFHPLYLKDRENGYHTQYFVDGKTMPELYEIVNTYKPDLIWSDGQWMASDIYWKSREFVAWLYNESPVKDHVVINDRWGNNTLCLHGGYFNCHDRHNPKVLQKHKWENAMTIDKGYWSFNRFSTLESFMTMDELTQTLAETVSCGGNLLMDIAPTADGRIVPIYEERLRQMGQWMKVNGEAIYSSKPWKYQNDTVSSGVWYTSKKAESGTNVYAIMLDWPKSGTLELGATPSPGTKVNMLGYPTAFQWQKRAGGGMTITIPPISQADLPCDWAWVFKMTGLV